MEELLFAFEKLGFEGPVGLFLGVSQDPRGFILSGRLSPLLTRLLDQAARKITRDPQQQRHSSRWSNNQRVHLFDSDRTPKSDASEG